MILRNLFLDIHLEGCDDNGEKLRIFAETGKPFAISLVPVLFESDSEPYFGIYKPNHFYSPEIVKTLKDISKFENILWGQQGNKHYCIECIEFNRAQQRELRDPWHENSCLHGRVKSVDEQKEFMKRGRDILEKIGISPRLYTSPNHLSDRNTFVAAHESDYDYFAIREMNCKLPFFKELDLTIIPERKFGEREAEVCYIHYDQIGNIDKTIEFLKASTPLDNIFLQEKPFFKVYQNNLRLIFHKFKRDMDKKRKVIQIGY